MTDRPELARPEIDRPGMARFRRVPAVAAELLLGSACAGCATPGPGLCPDCRSGLAATLPWATTPVPQPPGFPPTVAAGPYDEVMRRLISAHKERQSWLLTAPLADQLARAVRTLLDRYPGRCDAPVLLVRIPSSGRAVRTRGRDALAAIAAATGRRLRGPDLPAVGSRGLLRPVRRLADQSALSAEQRRDNLAGALVARSVPMPPGTRVVLVDDLVTTGSSLTEGARALAAAGVPLHGAAVIAATRRRGGARPRP